MEAAVQDDAPRDPDKVAEEEIARFEEWFLGIGEAKLTRFERAILKTYLLQRQIGGFKSLIP